MSDLHSLTPGTWNVDPTHSGLNFTVKHLMVSKVRG
jgi:polyisoprenoid-binding protein YceI